MNQLRINPQTVTHIKIDDLEATGFIWRDETPVKKVFFNLITVDYGWEGSYWYQGNPGSYTDKIDTLKSYMRDIGGEIYFLPSVSVFCGEKKMKTKHFETVEEAKEYATNNFPNVNIIM